MKMDDNELAALHIELATAHLHKSFSSFRRGDYMTANKENTNAKTFLKMSLELSRSPVASPPQSPAKFSSAKIHIHLPDELIQEILSWLPAKILTRFKGVSQKWYFLIIDPYFLKLHQEHQERSFFHEDEDETYFKKTSIGIFLENRNYAAAYKETCHNEKCLKAIVKGSTFDCGSVFTRRSRGSVFTRRSRRVRR